MTQFNPLGLNVSVGRHLLHTSQQHQHKLSPSANNMLSTFRRHPISKTDSHRPSYLLGGALLQCTPAEGVSCDRLLFRPLIPAGEGVPQPEVSQLQTHPQRVPQHQLHVYWLCGRTVRSISSRHTRRGFLNTSCTCTGSVDGQ